MARDALPCIVCNKPLRNVFADADNQPYVGTSFWTTGQYGSTVWDSMGSGERLEVNVCDTCLLRAGDSDKVLRYRPAPPQTKYLAPVPWREDDSRHHTLKENEKEYGSAWGADEPYTPAYEDVEADPFHTPEELRHAKGSNKGGEFAPKELHGPAPPPFLTTKELGQNKGDEGLSSGQRKEKQ